MDIQWNNTLRTLDEFGAEIINSYKKELEQEQYTNGELYNTLSYKVNSNNEGWVISISLADYWKYVEEGRPGKMKPEENKNIKQPPREVIEKWISVKHIIPEPRTLKSGKTFIPTIPQLAFLIARKIGNYGTKGKHLFANSFQGVKQMFISKLTEAITQDIKDYIERDSQ